MKKTIIAILLCSVLLPFGISAFGESSTEVTVATDSASPTDTDSIQDTDSDAEHGSIENEMQPPAAKDSQTGRQEPGDNSASDSNDPEKRFGELMSELYRYWLSYTEAEGDNGFEKAVNLAWKYRGDIGGISAAVAVAVLVAVMSLRFMPSLRRYVNYLGASNAQTRNEVKEMLSGELGKYAPALSTVEEVTRLYPAFRELIQGLSRENAEMRALISDIGSRIEQTEKQHSAELALQGATFRDIISLSALPASKKAEILENYRSIQAGKFTDSKEEQ
ncbi:MAG: hypothetical protein IKB34_06685 [Clostridia bacterium]|nr:hypothetical protein [Clostridia bacterium]